MHDNITQTYKKAPVNTKRKIDRVSKKFAKTLSLDDKMECYSDNPAYITLKDHKENFRNNTKCRLINPSKSEVGLVSKSYLSNIIASISKKTKVTQGEIHRRSLIGLKILQINKNGSLSSLI